MDAELLALSVLTAAETAHVFSQFEPSVFTIKKLAVPQGAEDEIRQGYVPALALGVGIAGAVSLITKSKLPLLFSIIVAGFTIGVYEWAIRTSEA
jgi:hypothetical protein